MEKILSKVVITKALATLDEHLDREVTLILGGGGCMILAHGFPLATSDVDALPLQMDFSEIDGVAKEVAKVLNLPMDWLNPYFSSFTHVLPADYRSRLKNVYKGKQLKVEALGREDMLIMKCFAHRPKDLGHARALIKAGADIKFVEQIIEHHQKRGIPNAQEALDFLDSLLEELE